MPKPYFEMEMGIDGNGVVVSRVRGTFDSTVWQRRREAIQARDFPDVDLAGRPIVCDVRGCRPPDENWNVHVARVQQVARRRHKTPCRRAFVTDCDLGMEMWIKLFIEHEKSASREPIESRLFTDFDAAYAWATAPWRAGD